MKIDELRRLDAAGTPAPWVDDVGTPTVCDENAYDIATVISDRDFDDSALIAAARNALPALLAVAEAARNAQLLRRHAEDPCSSDCRDCAVVAALAELEAQP